MRIDGHQQDFANLCTRSQWLQRVTKAMLREPRIPKPAPEWQLLQLLSAIRYTGYGRVLAAVLLDLLAEDITEIILTVLDQRGGRADSDPPAEV